MKLRKRNPDLLVILAILVAIGVVITSYTQKKISDYRAASIASGEVVYSQNKFLQRNREDLLRPSYSENE